VAALVVVDSSLVLATILQESYSAKAKTLLENWNQAGTQLSAPDLFRYEVVAVMRKKAYQKQISAEEALKGLNTLFALPVQFYIDDALLKRGYELSVKYNRPTAYDSQYLAVAERLGCEFWTTDERLYNSVNLDLNWVKWIGNFTPTSP
jgi:predicted nucleic acid-binding protein